VQVDTHCAHEIRFLILTCTVGLLSWVGKWELSVYTILTSTTLESNMRPRRKMAGT